MKVSNEAEEVGFHATPECGRHGVTEVHFPADELAVAHVLVRGEVVISDVEQPGLLDSSGNGGGQGRVFGMLTPSTMVVMALELPAALLWAPAARATALPASKNVLAITRAPARRAGLCGDLPWRRLLRTFIGTPFSFLRSPCHDL